MFATRKKYFVMLGLYLLLAVVFQPIATVLAEDPNPYDPEPEPLVYQRPPPAFPFQPNLANLPTAPAHQKFGIAAHPWWLDMFLDQFIAYYKDLKITTVRLPFEWKNLEIRPGVYRWEQTDRLLNRLNDEGFEVVAEFVTVPVWASLNPVECAKEDIQCNPDPNYASNLAEAAKAAARRYPFIRFWEFWNEPDMWPNMGQNDIGKYANWLKVFYDAVKSVDPTLLVAATSLSGPEYTDWLYGHADKVFNYRPWDAIAYHPYLTSIPDPTGGSVVGIRKSRVDKLREIMVGHGDGNKPIWLTEVGWEFPPEKQSLLLRDTFDFVAQRPFITLVHLHMLHDWDAEQYGLLRVKEDIYWKRPLRPTDTFEPKQPYYDAFKYYDKRPLPPQPPASNNVLVFPQTRHTVRDVFKQAYERGGLALFGYPQTGQFYERNPSDGQYYLVQYFERVRMEYHPENKGTQYEVLFGLLGSQLLKQRGWFDSQGRPLVAQVQPELKPQNTSNNLVWFNENQHSLSGLFLEEWRKQGGLMIIGLPISRVFEERNPDDGQVYQVQYFERSRAELHPGKNGQPAYILFGLLGNDVLRSQDRILANNQPELNNYYNPALPEFS